MSLSVYLAARFSRRPELAGYADELAEHGIEVTSRWLRGGHEWSGTDDDALPPEVGARFAQEDIEDIDRADVVVCFTEPPRSGPSRGGRHVELGYAYALNKDIVVVGPIENVFCALPEMWRAPDWAAAKAWLIEWSGRLAAAKGVA